MILHIPTLRKMKLQEVRLAFFLIPRPSGFSGTGGKKGKKEGGRRGNGVRIRRDGEEEETVGRGGRGEGTVSDHIAHLARNFSGRPVTLLIMQTGTLVYTGRTLCPRAAGQPYLSRWLSRCTGSRDFSKNGSGRDFSKNGSGWASESGETEPCSLLLLPGSSPDGGRVSTAPRGPSVGGSREGRVSAGRSSGQATHQAA